MVQGPISSGNGRVRPKLGNGHHPDHRCIFEPTRTISRKTRVFLGLKKLLLKFAKKIIKINLKLSHKTSFSNIIFKVHGSTFQRKNNNQYFFPKKSCFSPKKNFFQYEKKIKLFFGMPRDTKSENKIKIESIFARFGSYL